MFWSFCQTFLGRKLPKCCPPICCFFKKKSATLISRTVLLCATVRYTFLIVLPVKVCKIQRFLCAVFLQCYSWIADQRDTHEKLICQRTRRATTIPRPPLGNSRRGEFRSAGFILWSLFDLLMFKTSENMSPIKMDPADSDSSRQILVYHGLRPLWGVWDQWKTDF